MAERQARGARVSGAGLTFERQLAFWAAAIALFLLFVYTVSAVLAPFVAGLALGYLLDPVADRLQRAGLSRLGASLCILTAFLSVVTAVVFFAAPILTHQLSDFVVSLPGYLTTLQGLIARVSREATGDFARSVYEKLGLSTADAPSEIQKYVNDLTAEATRMAAAFVKSLVSGGAALVNVAALVVITPVVAFYILLDWDNMVATLGPARAAASSRGHSLHRARHRPGARRLRARPGDGVPVSRPLVQHRLVAARRQFRLSDRRFRGNIELRALCRIDHRLRSVASSSRRCRAGRTGACRPRRWRW